MIDFDIVRLTKDHNVLAFDCGNKDINDFLMEDAYEYQEGLLAVTYLALNKSHDDVLSYFCLLNDKLAYFPGDDKKAWNKLNRKVSNHKRMKSYPAVKIGRLGTQRMCSGQGLARDIIDYIKVLFTNGNRTGCRFLTVDAHRDAVGFYEKCGFSYFTDLYVDEDTRLMYFDLKPFRDACGL